jgi:HD-GYP domain-containing protein (c-di-GMP phosphodiesterase class II)
MLFNLNEFLISLSFALDFVEMDLLGSKSNHGKRTAYISLKLAKQLGLDSKKLYDIVALAILHDNGISEKSLHDKLSIGNFLNIKRVEAIKEHCLIGEKNISSYPFLTDVKNVIKYHHENYDGTGFFKVKGDEIPLMSQIIHISDAIERNFDLKNNDIHMQSKVLKFTNSQKNKMFSSDIINAFVAVANNENFWMNLKDHNISNALKNLTPQYTVELTIKDIRKITGVFSKIIDSKSKYTRKHSSDLSNKAAFMIDYYNMNHEEGVKLMIAADLHDIGKLAIPNDILDSPNKLTNEEFETIKKHPYLTRLALQEIKGFEEITEWASNHHEKLNGQGYPFGKTAKDLDFNSRLMACLDIYEALTEERPYRHPLSHREAMNILNNMKDKGYIDEKITNDIDYVFGALR